MGAGTPREWKNRGGLLVFSCFFALLGLGRSQSVMQKQNSTTLHETTQRTMNWKTSLAVPEISCLHHRLLVSSNLRWLDLGCGHCLLPVSCCAGLVKSRSTP